MIQYINSELKTIYTIEDTAVKMYHRSGGKVDPGLLARIHQ